MRAGRKREVRRVVERRLVQAGLELVQRIIVRHIRGERDLGEGFAAIGPCHAELAVLEFDVGLRRFEQVRGDLLALRNHLVERLHDGRSADGERTRSIRAHAEQHAPGIAVHDVDVLDWNAEARRNDLRECRLVTLPVTVRAGEDRHAAGRMDADFTGFDAHSSLPSPRTRNVIADAGFLAVSFSSLKAAFHCSMVAAWPLPKAALASAYS